MHMADALLSPAVAGTMYAFSAVAAGVSIKKFSKVEVGETDFTKVELPKMAVMAALVFAGQMVNYTIPGTGSSGHLCGGMMLSALLGPYAGFLSMITVLLIQCLFFADGGLMAFGANVWNMAFYGCFVGYFLIYRPIMKSRLLAAKGEKASYRAKIILSSILGCVVTLQLGAFSVCIETSLSGITQLPFGAFMALMQPIHLAIGLIEGIITAAVLVFVYENRPQMVREVGSNYIEESDKSYKRVLVILAAVVLVTGGGISLLASSNPDGLEWSLFGNEDAGYSANMGLDEDAYGIDSVISEKAGEVVESTAFLPDYAFASNPDATVGTTVSGIVGSLIVAVVAGLICFAGGLARKKRA